MSGFKENSVSISGYRLIECNKPYYVYIIHVHLFQQHYIVEKRYSELHQWHTEHKNKFATPSFPPKKIRSNQYKVLEDRCHLLELYLKEMFKFGTSRNQLLSFLGVNSKNSPAQPSPSKSNDHKPPIDSTSKRIEHKPVFVVNPNMEILSRTSGEHDIIVEGTLQALYG